MYIRFRYITKSKNLRTTKKRLALHLKMETIARMKITADFYRESLGQYAKDILTLHGLWLEKQLKKWRNEN